MADIIHTRLELCNMIRMEAEHTENTGFPLEVFPQTVQSVILDMARYENYKTEFIATAMISAVSAALGGTYRIRIKGEWQSNAALYIILVGRPGLGKTPPLEAAYRPIRKHDYTLFKAYESELESWKAAGENGKKPVLRRTVVSDFTPESLLLTHSNNPRSVVILVDEIMGMFNSANRYTNGQLIEQLLTAWSGGALDVTRVGNTVPVHIEQPCINIAGTTQTKRVHELLTKGFEENGLLDRILFVLPKSREVSKWTDWDDGGEDRASLAAARWEQILGKVLALDYDTGEEERISHVLSMDREAKEYFFSWWNRKVERINRIEDDAEVDSREMKHPAQVARLALLMQVLRYASGESHLQSVDMVSVKAAVRLNGYFEDSYRRIRSFVAEDMCEEPPKVLLSLLPDTFDTKTAIATGREQQNVSERTVMNYLKELCRSRLLRKAKAGHYEKVIYDKSGKSNENDNEPQPETATDDPLLQPAVFAVLQSRSTGKVKFLQDCKNCRLQMAVFICRNPQKEHHERIQIPSTEIPSGQQDRLSGVRQESLLHPLYRRGRTGFVPRQCRHLRPYQQLRLPLHTERILPGQSVCQRKVE